MTKNIIAVTVFCISVSIFLGTQSNAAWFMEQLDTYVSTGAEMIQGSDGNIHISYVGTDGLVYACHKDRSWHFEILGILDSSSDSPSIALDSSGNPHILATDNVTDTCWYLHATGDVWISEKIAEVTEANINDCRIAIDADDTVHALYSLDFQPMQYGMCPDGGNWTWETPDPVNNSMGIWRWIQTAIPISHIIPIQTA